MHDIFDIFGVPTRHGAAAGSREVVFRQRGVFVTVTRMLIEATLLELFGIDWLLGSGWLLALGLLLGFGNLSSFDSSNTIVFAVLVKSGV